MGTTRCAWWHYSYLLDYFVVGIVLTLAFVVPPNVRHPVLIPNFDREDLTPQELREIDSFIAFPTVAPMLSYNSVVVLSLAPVFLLAALRAWRLKTLDDVHAVFLSLLEGLSITLFASEFLKKFTGVMRPDFLSRCEPEIIDDRFNCTFAHDGFESFPSGNAATAFFGATFTSLYFASKFALFEHQTNSRPLWKFLLTITPYVFAVWVSAARVRDYAHRVSDINSGALIGGLIGYGVYFLQYPALNSEQSATPLNRNANPNFPGEQHHHKQPKNISEYSSLLSSSIATSAGVPPKGTRESQRLIQQSIQLEKARANRRRSRRRSQSVQNLNTTPPRGEHTCVTFNTVDTRFGPSPARSCTPGREHEYVGGTYTSSSSTLASTAGSSRSPLLEQSVLRARPYHHTYGSSPGHSRYGSSNFTRACSPPMQSVSPMSHQSTAFLPASPLLEGNERPGSHSEQAPSDTETTFLSERERTPPRSS